MENIFTTKNTQIDKGQFHLENPRAVLCLERWDFQGGKTRDKGFLVFSPVSCLLSPVSQVSSLLKCSSFIAGEK
jgi:hypothetical protein